MTQEIAVKLISKNRLPRFQFVELPRPDNGVHFVFDPDCRDYDWLFVYDDLPPTAGERLPVSSERLSCSRARTILLTYEPSSIRCYGDDYVRQFGTVMTSQDPDSLRHPNRVPMPPIGRWFYGAMSHVEAHPVPPRKSRMISVFGSGKRMTHSLHAVRHRFLNDIARQLEGEIDVYGRGFAYVETKSEALDDYRYHIAVENHIAPDHWTEKLSDSFLGYCLPFYAGCPNAADYFPAESFIRLDMRDSASAVGIIRRAMETGEYEKRLPAIIEARRRVLEEYNLGHCLSSYVASHHEESRSEVPDGSLILSRHALMRSNPRVFLRYAADKLASRRRYRRLWRDYLSQPEVDRAFS